METGRRKFLERAVAGVGTVGLAGCSAIRSGPGDGDETEYTQWLYRPDPGAYYPDVEDAASTFGFGYTEPEHVVERKGAFVGSGMTERTFETDYVARYGMHGVEGSDVARWVRQWVDVADRSRARRIFAEGMAARFDGEEMRASVAEGATQREGYEGWDVYDAGTRATAVSDRHVVRVYVPATPDVSDPERSLVEVLEDAVDVVDGRRDPYESGDVRVLADALGDGPHVSANVFEEPRDRPFPETLAVGKIGLDAGDRRMRNVALFPDTESASPDAARRQWEDGFEQLESVERDGRSVVATGTAEPSTWLS